MYSLLSTTMDSEINGNEEQDCGCLFFSSLRNRLSQTVHGGENEGISHI